MRRISGQLLSSKPISLSVAAKRLTSFAALENGASASVSIYLQRTAQAFNELVLLQEPFKQQQNVKKEENLDYQIDQKLEINDVGVKLDKSKKSKKKKKKSDDGLKVESENVEKKVKTEEISFEVDAKVEKKRKRKNKDAGDINVVQVKTEEICVEDAKVEKKRKKNKKTGNDVGVDVQVKKEED